MTSRAGWSGQYSLETLLDTNNTVRHWSANCGSRPNCKPFSSFRCVGQHLLLWAAWYVRAKVLRRLRGIEHKQLQQIWNIDCLTLTRQGLGQVGNAVSAMLVRRGDVSAVVIANILYEKKCFWNTSVARLQRMFAC